MAVLRDVAVAGAIVLVLLAGIWIYSGQPLNQAPVVSVESGSMMHGPYLSGDLGAPTGWAKPPFGRIGTIDPGDIVFVKDVDEAEDIEVVFGSGGRDGYGGHGDVIVYQPDGNEGRTRIIHRAMLYVEANVEGCVPNQNCVYRIPAVCDNPAFDTWNRGQSLDKYCAGSSDPINLDLNRDGLRLFAPNYPPCTAPSAGSCGPFYSSFITKGDNNREVDQTHGISGPVRIDWIIGKARGEIPWFGLIKLALYGNDNYQPRTDPTLGANWKILAATAPADIWTCLLLSMGILIAIPMVIDFIGNIRQKRKGREGPPQP
jgi:signal peptidase I